MAYITNTTRPALIASGMASRNAPSPLGGVSTLGSKQPALWIMSGTDSVATVRATGFITDARDLGMQVGDLLQYVDTDASPITLQLMIVTAINGTTGAGDLSDGTAIDATNT